VHTYPYTVYTDHNSHIQTYTAIYSIIQSTHSSYAPGHPSHIGGGCWDPGSAIYRHIQSIHSPYSPYTSLEAPCSLYTAHTAHIQPHTVIHSPHRAHTVHIQASRRHTIYIQCVKSPCRPIQTYIQRIHPIYSHIQSIYSPHSCPGTSVIGSKRLKLTMLIPPSSCRGGHPPGPPPGVYSPNGSIQITYVAIHSPYTTHTAHIQPYTAIHSPYRAHTVHIQASRRHTVYIQCVYSPCRPIQAHI
jgi:hypothetical protein